MNKERTMLLHLLVALAVLALLAPAAGAQSDEPEATTALAVVEPNGSGDVLAELDEYATQVLGDPWDMNESTDLDFFYPYESALSDSAFSNGVYSARMTAGDGRERISLLTAGAQGHQALRTGRIGYNYPIDANRYHYLTFRMYSSNTTCNSGMIQWFADDSYASAVMGISNGFLVPPNPCFGQAAGWHTYSVDLRALGIYLGGQPWTGAIRELLLHPFAGNGAAGATVKLDWARLTAADPTTARPYTVRWTGNGSGGTVTLWASPGNRTLDADDILIAQGQSAAGGSYVYQTGVLPAGDYYVAATNSSGTAWSAGPLTISRPPAVRITKPSPTSGPEFSAGVLGRPWDMNEPGDVNDDVPPMINTCVSNPRTIGGIYAAEVPPGCPNGATYADPILFLGGMNRNPPGTPDPVVDTNRYRYLSFRFVESGNNFSMMRFGWWRVNDSDNGVVEETVLSRDILIIDGWHTYTVDLWAPDVIDEDYPAGTLGWRESHPNRLRFDPNEMFIGHLPVTIQLDWISLNAMDSVKRGQRYVIQYAPAAGRPNSLEFFYDTDRDAGNGRTRIAAVPALTAAQGSYGGQPASPERNAAVSPAYPVHRYLPMVASGAICSGGCYSWDTSSVPAGTYYIAVRAADAQGATEHYSEAPVMVVP